MTGPWRLALQTANALRHAGRVGHVAGVLLGVSCGLLGCDLPGECLKDPEGWHCSQKDKGFITFLRYEDAQRHGNTKQ